MTEKNHFAALQEIRNWNTDDVICALRNNGLCECVDACKKREITGEKLLELSEMKIGLWKRDLSTANIRKLARFIQDISKMPGKYIGCTVSSGDDAWDTDFDDDEIEEDSGQKSENNIPRGMKLERKSRLLCSSSEENGNTSIHNLVNKNHNTQKNGNHFSPVNRNITSLHRNKINIPKAFSDDPSPQNGSSTNSPLGNTLFSKVNGLSESMEFEKPNVTKNLKPSVPSRPPSLHIKTSPQESPRTTLPKPPEFDNEGLVLREICDKLSLEPELVDEYESIDDDLLHAQNIKSRISGFKNLGGSQNSVHQSSLESHQKTPVFQNSVIDVNQYGISSLSLHHNNVSPKINTLSQQISKTDISNALENMKKSPILPRVLVKKEEETLQTSKNLPFVSQEKQTYSHSSPVPLPPRNEVKQDVSPTSTLNVQSSRNALRLNNRPVITVTSETSKKSKALEEQKEKNDVNESTLHEDVYESIPEHASRKSMGVENCEDYSGYLQPIAPPSLPPKPKQASYTKSSEKLNGEAYGPAVNSWHFGTQFKSKQKSQEKASPDGKKNNTLPKPRPLNSCVSETSRPSASRPLPPPPIPDGNVQRVAKIPLEQMPWYFNVDRTRGKEILRNCEDGTFMIRPSTQNALTLSLKYGSRSFNICVRVRPDGKFALGTAKPTEQTFSSVEELVNFYTTNELLLYSNGKQAGIVVLTSPPRKDNIYQ